MLTLIPAGWFSWSYRVLRDGADLTRIARPWFREQGSFVLEGVRYEVRRTGWLCGIFALERDGVLLAEATKPSVFRRAFEISVRDDRLDLRAASPFGRTFGLWRGSEPLGTVRPVSVWGRTATADFAAGVAPEVQLFVVFLVLVLWKRAADAAAAGS